MWQLCLAERNRRDNKVFFSGGGLWVVDPDQKEIASQGNLTNNYINFFFKGSQARG
jgi:hypothetical protein